VEEPTFVPFLRKIFAQKRKTLSNNLRAAGYSPDAISAALNQAAIDPRARAEAISIETLAALWRALETQQQLP
jgi:16S rRNA (adenine1518-N6/adenine1519-N6)-dimethyltransferase